MVYIFMYYTFLKRDFIRSLNKKKDLHINMQANMKYKEYKERKQ